jgi:hypothetical protein
MITQSELKEVLHYDADTGIFTWITKRQGVTLGIAGCVTYTGKSKKNYIHIGVHQKRYKAHRLAFLYMTGSLPKYQVDHINGNGTDNRFVNLRLVDNLENSRNTKKRDDNTSGISGVNWHKQTKKWRARINVKGKSIHLGLYDKIESAIAARKQAIVDYGFHENHGSERPL